MERYWSKPRLRIVPIVVTGFILLTLQTLQAVPIYDPSLTPESNGVILPSQKEIPEYLQIARGYLRKGNFSQVISISEQILAMEKDTIEARAMLIAAYLGNNRQEEFSKAELLFRKMAPGSSALDLFLAETYIALGDIKKAEETYRQGLTRSQVGNELHMGLATLYAKRGNIAGATQEYNAVLEKNNLPAKDFLNANYALCRIELQQGKNDQVIQRANMVAKRYPPIHTSYMFMATAYLHRGKITQAIATYNTLMKVAPDSVVPYQELALLYCDKLRDFDKAMQHANQAVKKFPKDAKSRDVLGWVYYQQQEYEQALQQFLAAERLGGEDPRYLYHLGLAYRATGASAKAITAFDRAMLAAGNNKQALKEHIETLK